MNLDHILKIPFTFRKLVKTTLLKSMLYKVIQIQKNRMTELVDRFKDKSTDPSTLQNLNVLASNPVLSSSYIFE